MKNNASKKSWFVLVIVIAAVIVVYYTFFDQSSSQKDNELLETQSENQLIGTEVLNMMNQIQSLKIDTSIFKSPAFTSLVDYTVAIPDLNVGRGNPFAPLPGYVAPSGTNR